MVIPKDSNTRNLSVFARNNKQRDELVFSILRSRLFYNFLFCKAVTAILGDCTADGLMCLQEACRVPDRLLAVMVMTAGINDHLAMKNRTTHTIHIIPG